MGVDMEPAGEAVIGLKRVRKVLQDHYDISVLAEEESIAGGKREDAALHRGAASALTRTALRLGVNLDTPPRKGEKQEKK
jgi:hypothetical protein